MNPFCRSLSVYHSLQVTQCPLSVSGRDVKVTANAGGWYLSFFVVQVFVAIDGLGASHAHGLTEDPDLLQCGLLFSLSISVCSDSTASAKRMIITGGEAVF